MNTRTRKMDSIGMATVYLMSVNTKPQQKNILTPHSLSLFLIISYFFMHNLFFTEHHIEQR